MESKVSFTRVNNDVNGNPRYVCHFMNLLNSSESWEQGLSINDKYNLALSKSRQLGGKKFHNKQYGGGIVFQSYNIGDLENDILELQKPS